MSVNYTGQINIYPQMSKDLQRSVKRRLRKITRNFYLMKDTILLNGKCYKNSRFNLRELISYLILNNLNLNGIIEYSGDLSGFYNITNSVIKEIPNTKEMNIKLTTVDKLVAEIESRGFYVKLGAVKTPVVVGAISDNGIIQDNGQLDKVVPIIQTEKQQVIDINKGKEAI